MCNFFFLQTESRLRRHPDGLLHTQDRGTLYFIENVPFNLHTSIHFLSKTEEGRWCNLQFLLFLVPLCSPTSGNDCYEGLCWVSYELASFIVWKVGGLSRFLLQSWHMYCYSRELLPFFLPFVLMTCMILCTHHVTSIRKQEKLN